MKAHQEVIASILGYSVEQYAQVIYERAMEWLNYYHRGNAAAVDLFSSSRRFWDAWTEQFAAVDLDLLDGLRSDTVAALIDDRCEASHRDEFRDSWCAAHRIEEVRECPDRATLRLMSDELRDQITQQYHDDSR